MSAVPFELIWGPGLIGSMVGFALYGVGIGQFIFYVRAFPCDKFYLRALVLVVFIFDSLQTFTLAWFYYQLLIRCRLSPTPNCATHIPPLSILGICVIYWTTFIVQSFYAHRVWIISGRNRVITSTVLFFALAQLVLGLLVIITVVPRSTFQVLFSTKYSALAAVSSAVCDAIITTSIIYYLRPARTGIIRQSNYIRKLNAVFVQMGVFSFINASAVAILYWIQSNGTSQFLTAAPGAILSKAYVNSMLSVLNARKPIREEEQARAQRTIEIPTIPTIW